MAEDISKRKICPVGCSVRIIAHKNNEDTLVDGNEKLKWPIRPDGWEDDLTLQEISEQLKGMGYEPVFDLWWEIGLRGEIYRYGNYDPPTWVEHGTTKGYA